jgi:hypothetical protein
MKKLTVIISLVLISTLYGKSQFLIGGNVSFDGQGGKTVINDNTTKMTSTFSFDLSPQIGYRISEKMDIGAYLSLGYNHTDNNEDPALIENRSFLGVRPFLRYYAFTLNKFSVYGEATLPFTYYISKSHQGDTEFDDVKTVNLGVAAYPGMSYRISERVELTALIKLFTLGVSQSIEKTDDQKESFAQFHFGVDMDNIFTTGSINVGVIYRFK